MVQRWELAGCTGTVPLPQFPALSRQHWGRLGTRAPHVVCFSQSKGSDTGSGRSCLGWGLEQVPCPLLTDPKTSPPLSSSSRQEPKTPQRATSTARPPHIPTQSCPSDTHFATAAAEDPSSCLLQWGYPSSPRQAPLFSDWENLRVVGFGGWAWPHIVLPPHIPSPDTATATCTPTAGETIPGIRNNTRRAAVKAHAHSSERGVTQARGKDLHVPSTEQHCLSGARDGTRQDHLGRNGSPGDGDSMLLAKLVLEALGCWCKAPHQGALGPPAPHFGHG